MKLLRHSQQLRRCVNLLVLASFCLSLTAGLTVQAAPDGQAAKVRDKVSSDLRELAHTGSSNQELVSVIIQFSDKPSGPLNALLNRNDVHVRAHFANFNSSLVELPLSTVEELAAFSEVSYISVNREVDSLGHVETTTGALAARAQQGSLDGRGITIAVLDSGIYNGHVMFAGTGRSLWTVCGKRWGGRSGSEPISSPSSFWT